LIRALMASMPKKITVLSQPDARPATGDASKEPGSVTRTSQTPARLVSSPPISRAAKTKTATTTTIKRYALANQLPKRKPKTFLTASQIHRLTVVRSPASRFSDTRTDFLIGSR
jgi:hypothetical protein